MTVNEFITKASLRLGDQGKEVFTLPEYITAINDAISQISLDRIAASDPDMIVDALVNDDGSMLKPEGFISFVGQEPFYFENNQLKTTDNVTFPTRVRMFCCKPHISSQYDDIPFDERTSNGAIMDYVVTLLGARIGYNSEVESNMAQMADSSYLQAVNVSRPMAVSNNAKSE